MNQYIYELGGRMDIKEMLKQLTDAGMTQHDIAEAVGTTQPTIYRALNGADIRYRVGKAIERFYQQHTEQQEAA